MAQSATQEAIESALRHHQAGRLQQAEQLYRQVLAHQPDHVVAMHYLGVIAHQMKRHDDAVDLIRRAIALNPNYAEAHNNLGNALKDTGRIEEAIASFRRVLAINPGSPAAHVNLGIALNDVGKVDEAIAAYRKAIALDASLAQAHTNLGNALKVSGRLDEAIAAHRHAVALNPRFPGAWNNLGNGLRDKGDLDEAIASYRQAVALDPGFAEAHCNLGDVLKDRGKLDEAIAAYRQAIDVNPIYAQACNNLGNALKDNGQLDEAIGAYHRAIALRPELHEAHYNLGGTLKSLGQDEASIAAYRQAIQLKPNFSQAYYNLGNTLLSRWQLDEAIAAYGRAIELLPDFAGSYLNLGNALVLTGRLDDAIRAYRQAMDLRPQETLAHSSLVYALQLHPAYDARAIAAELRDWNRRYAEPFKAQIKVHANDRRPDRRLRIGYVSPDFRDHPVGRFLIPLVANHDSRSFEVFAYSHLPVSDAMTARLRGHMDVWRDIAGLSDAQAAELIRQDRIDILVDLSLHTANDRLLVFARKPAPVQVTYLAYPGSSGLSTMDYRLSDPWLDPQGEDESVYSEQTIRLPETYWCYQPVVDLPHLPPPSLETGFVTFGCLNNFCKVNDPLLRLWARLLKAVPRSRLILHAQEGSHRQRVLEFLQREGVDLQRVSIAGIVPAKSYFASYHSIDIALDTLPHCGGTTTCDALWMGVPVVSLTGATAVGRGGSSILSNIGLPELVAKTPEEYVKIAAGLASDTPRLKELRSTLRQRMAASPLMDAPKFARNMEAAYRRMWRNWCEGRTPGG